MTNYAENLSQRTPCILVLDASASMEASDGTGRTRIALLNDSIAAFHADLRQDELALSRVQIAAINVGGFSATPQLFLDWTDANDFAPFELFAGHATPLGEAMLLALDTAERQKNNLRQFGISYTRPWIFVLTDGAPTDTDARWREACKRVRQSEAENKVLVFPVGVGDVDLTQLAELSTMKPQKTNSASFREMFLWLSGSLRQVSRSVAGSKIDLPSTDSWAGVRL